MKQNQQLIRKCPWCESEKTQVHLWLKDEFLSKEDFKIYECNNCNLLFTEPHPGKDKIGEYYKSEEYFSHQENKEGFIPKVYERIKAVNLKAKYKMATQGMERGTALDIGCGTGDFIQTMEKKGWNAIGIEPADQAKEIAHKRVKAKLLSPNEIGELANESFDLITMWHVLEHVDNLQEEIAHLQRLLKKSGRLVLALPNHKSFDAHYYMRFWAAYDVPRHLYHFSKPSITKIFRNTDLALTGTDKLVWDAYYISYMSEKYMGRSFPLIRGALKGLTSNCKARKTGEWSSLVYVLEKKGAKS